MTPVSVNARDDGVLDVVLRGEIDYTNAAPVTDTVTGAVDRVRPSAVRVDLHEVTFLDSSGIGVLITAMKAARAVTAAVRGAGANPKGMGPPPDTRAGRVFPVDLPGAPPEA